MSAVASIIRSRVAAAQDNERARFAAAVEAAFDQGELDCGRLGLPCTAANSSDRWCRACRIRAILDLPGGAA